MRLFSVTVVVRADDDGDNFSPKVGVDIDVEDGVPSDLAYALAPVTLRRVADQLAETSIDDVDVTERN